MYCVVQIGSRMLRFECGTTRSTLSCASAVERKQMAAATRAARRMRESPRSERRVAGEQGMVRIAIKAPKVVLLWARALLSFISPLAESFLTGTVEPFSTYGIVETVVSLVLLF